MSKPTLQICRIIASIHYANYDNAFSINLHRYYYYCLLSVPAEIKYIQLRCQICHAYTEPNKGIIHISVEAQYNCWFCVSSRQIINILSAATADATTIVDNVFIIAQYVNRAIIDGNGFF